MLNFLGPQLTDVSFYRVTGSKEDREGKFNAENGNYKQKMLRKHETNSTVLAGDNVVD